MKRAAPNMSLVQLPPRICTLSLLLAFGLGAIACDRLGLESELAKEQKNQARASIKAVEIAIGFYEVDTGALPNGLHDLLVKGSVAVWNGPYVRDAQLLRDPWGTEYQYSRMANDYSVKSAGPDKIFDTKDDVK